MTTLRLSATALALCLLASAPIAAQPDTGTSAKLLRIATGQKGKGYSKLFADLQVVCGAQIPMTEVHTEGGLQNLTSLAANRADLGFVQIDTLQDMKSSDEAIAALRAVLALNHNLLHLVARTDGFTYDGPKRVWPLSPDKVNVVVTRVSELKGLPVAVVGSARALGRVLDRRHALGLQFVDVDTDEQALAKLRSGEVAALLSTSGWPSGPILKLKRDAGVRLLQFDLPVQSPYQLMRKNYENLDAFNHAFLAAPNLLVTRAFTASGVKGRAVAELQACIRKNLVNLQEGEFEPAWREVKDLAGTHDWPRFAGTAAR